MQHPNADDIRMFYGLRGMKCFEAKRGFESNLQVDFALPQQDEKRRGTQWLMVLCWWHLGGPQGMIASSSNAPDKMDYAVEMLLGREVIAMDMDDVRGSARLSFDGGFNLSLFFDIAADSVGWSIGHTFWDVGRDKGEKILSSQEARFLYGRNGEEVAGFIHRLAGYPWFANVGGSLSNETRTIPVTSWQEAISLYGSTRVRTQRWRNVLLMTERIAAGDKDHPLLKTCFAAWNDAREVAEASAVDFAPQMRYWIIQRIAMDAARAAHELVLGHLTRPPRYYRDLMSWYEEGHWPCETTEEGRQYVF